MRRMIAQQPSAALSGSVADRQRVRGLRPRTFTAKRRTLIGFDRRQAVKYACPNSRISRMIGRSASPFSVSSYSTRGGLSA